MTQFKQAVNDTLLAIGYMQGVEDGYNDDTMDYFLNESNGPEQLISGLSNMILILLDDASNATGRLPKEILQTLAYRFNISE